MNQLEENILNSFRLAKRDIIKLQTELIRLSQNQEKMMGMFSKFNADEARLSQKVKDIDAKPAQTKVVRVFQKSAAKKIVSTKRAKKIYVAQKEGKKFHVKNCPYAQNIHPKNKVIFKTKTKALNQGFKPCKCIK